MRIRQNRRHGDLATEYQFQLIRLLDAALVESGIPDSTREEICERFVLDHARLHDQGTIGLRGRSSIPVLAFAEEDDLLVPDGSFELEEYAQGNVAEYFDGGGD